ncbi:MerR family transcriptional regulator [Nisaea sp.]|uniref:MerR family transcriptional regulator n=1 Tax=Nisaea sp. TaxID=2024842 RepID=UPI0032631B46
MAVEAYFTTKQVQRIVGFGSASMVDYLHRTGVVEASIKGSRGRGRPRLYNYTDLLLLKALKQILDKGIAVARLKKAQEQFRQIHSEHADATESIARFLITDGTKVFYKASPDAIIELSDNNQLSFAFVVDMNRESREIRQKIIDLGYDSSQTATG